MTNVYHRTQLLLVEMGFYKLHAWLSSNCNSPTLCLLNC
jgi:hypothetical protein